MNLYYEPTMFELKRLIDTAHKSLTAHNIVVDYDGEVIIDPELKYPNVSLNKFKFHTRINQAAGYSERRLQALYRMLKNAYEGKVTAMHIKNIKLAA